MRTAFRTLAIATVAVCVLVPAAAIAGGTGGLAGARGSFTIASEPLQPCTYGEHVVQ